MVASCYEIFSLNVAQTNGSYYIFASNSTRTSSYCSLTILGLKQIIYKSNRISTNKFFAKSWANYKVGFGGLCSDYWLGLDYIHSLTLSGNKSVYIEMYSEGTTTKYDVLYSSFSVGDESSRYVLSLGAKTSGSLNDLSAYHNGLAFSTYDNENSYNSSCSKRYSAGWWFNKCFLFCLTCDLPNIGNYYDLTTNTFLNYDRMQMTIQP